MAKFLIYIGMFIGGVFGAYIPSVLFGTEPLSVIGIIFGAVGSCVGLWVGYKANQWLGE